tara:strand:+ start:775 stop:1116 length:342 start_codon:yes stop_codon:yes gene_type:complete
MRKDIHPENYRDVIFHDTTSGEKFLLGSTVATEGTDTWTDGKEYPVYRLEVSSASHPFYTGQEMTLDTGGRVDRFKKRMAAATPKKAAPKAEEAKPAEAPVDENQETSEEDKA